MRMFNRIYEDRQTFIKTMTENIEMIILRMLDIGVVKLWRPSLWITGLKNLKLN